MPQTRCASAERRTRLRRRAARMRSGAGRGGRPRPDARVDVRLRRDEQAAVSWPAAGLGLAIIVGLQALVGLAVVPFLSKSILAGRSPNIIGFWAAMIVIGAAIYFGTGFVLGRYSKGYLVREPFMAALVAAGLNWVLEHFVYRNQSVTVPMLAVGGLLFVAIAYVGGMAGEQVQQKLREQRRALAALGKKS